MRAVALVLLFGLLVPASAQVSMTDHSRFEKLLAIVPMIGAGTWDDPKRPMFVPARSAGTARNQIRNYHYTTSDDGRFALVEFSAVDRAAFAEILASRVPGVKAFVRGRSTRGEIESEFRRLKPNFDLDKFVGRRP